MKQVLNRREFAKELAIAGAAAALPQLNAAPQRAIEIGYTCLTWNAVPRTPENLEPALRDISNLGFYTFETFSQILEDWDAKGTLQPLIDRYGVPLRSGYCGTNLMDATQRKESVAKVVRWAKVIQKYGGTFAVLQPNKVDRGNYNFQDHKADIIAGLNEHAKAIADVGLASGLHQHTGTCIETKDEVYTVMDAVNTKYVKFAPDVGQLQNGGSDAAKVVEDFLPILRHMHLKDYNGSGDFEKYFAGYCPLGEGKVDIAGILSTLEKAGTKPEVLVELDRSANAPMTALKAGQISKAYLEKLGYQFRKPHAA